MAFTPGSVEIDSNSTTDVDLVGSPAASTQRLVKSLTVYNADTVPATVTLKRDKAGTEHILAKEVLSVGATMLFEVTQVLDATDEKIQVVLAAAVTTNQLECTATYADLS